MKHIQELRDRAQAYLDTSRKILDRADEAKRQLTPAEKRDFDGLVEKANNLKSLVRSADQVRGLLDAGNKTALGPLADQVRNPLMLGEELRAYRSDELMGPQSYDGPGLGAWIKGAVTGKWEPEHRALAESYGTSGGFLVPSPLAGYVIDLARARSVVVNAGALTVPMENATLNIPRLLTDPVCGWRNENDPIVEGDPTFGSSGLTARSLGTLVSISNELLMDSPLADATITNAITAAMAVAMDTGYLMGTGAGNQPFGIINKSGIQTLSMGANGAPLSDFSTFVQAAGLIAAVNGPSDGLSMIVSVREDTKLNGLQDTLHQPLRMPDVVARMKRGVTSKIPTNLTQGTTVGTASWAMVGDMSQVVIGMRQQFTLEISREAGSAFANNQTLVRAILRTDVGLLQPKFIVQVQGILPA
jgi:HK97 family phage major capsid protein